MIEPARRHRPALITMPLFVSGLVLATLTLGRIGAVIPPIPVGRELGPFLQTTDPLLVSFALLRLAGLVLCWYLLATTALGLLARLTRIPSLVRAVDVVTLPSVWRLLRGVAGMSLATSLAATGLTATAVIAVTRPAPAIAAPNAPTTTPPGSDPTMRLLDDPPPPASAVPGRPATMSVVDEPAPAPTTAPRTSSPTTIRVVDEPPVSPASPSPTTSSPGAPTGAPVPPAPVDPGPTRPVDAAPPISPPPGPGPSPSPAEGAPSSTEAGPSSADAGPTPAVSTWTIAPGDHLWHVSQATLRSAGGHEPSDAETAAYLRRLIDRNRGIFAVAGNADLVFPGQVFELPTV